jgi:hypothetical protein
MYPGATNFRRLLCQKRQNVVLHNGVLESVKLKFYI